jgi:hypothetical protein
VVGPLLVITQLHSGQSAHEALRGSVAGLTGLVPEGLVLLTSIAMAVGVVRLAARRVLVQDLPAIEGLARVDVICCDKTGTLTQGSMHVVAVEPVPSDDLTQDRPPVAQVLGALAAADPRRNATMLALADRFADAPEMMLAGADPAGVAERAGRLAAEGFRVLLLASTPGGLTREQLPEQLLPVALVALQERVRLDAQATLEYFAAPGFLRRALRFAIPAGFMTGAAALTAFLTVRALDLGLPAARTSATVVTLGLSLLVLATLARPLAGWRGAMVTALACLFAGLFAVPWLRHELALELLPQSVYWFCAVITVASYGLLVTAWSLARRVLPQK